MRVLGAAQWLGISPIRIHSLDRYPSAMGEPLTDRIDVVNCHVMERDWSVTFFDLDTGMHIGPWLLCDSPEEVVKILTWGHISGPDLDEHYRNIRRWGVGGGNLHLSSREHHQLIAGGRGWPWNGYELRRMKDVGRYPPQRLTLSQVAAYQRSPAAKGARRY